MFIAMNRFKIALGWEEDLKKYGVIEIAIWTAYQVLKISTWCGESGMTIIRYMLHIALGLQKKTSKTGRSLKLLSKHTKELETLKASI